MKSDFEEAIKFYKGIGYYFINSFLLSSVLEYKETFDDLVSFKGDISRTPEFLPIRGKSKNIDAILDQIVNSKKEDKNENFIRGLITIINIIDRSLNSNGCMYLKDNKIKTLYRGMSIDQETLCKFVSGRKHLFHT